MSQHHEERQDRPDLTASIDGRLRSEFDPAERWNDFVQALWESRQWPE